MRHLFSEGSILCILLLLYGIVELGLHWWGMYWKHHKVNLKMITLTYDLCLFITDDEDVDQDGAFAIIGLQTDDSLILADVKFIAREQRELEKANFNVKPVETLTSDHSLQFNGCSVKLDGKDLLLQQNGQGKRLEEVDFASPDYKQRFIEQWARLAYIVSICQPEASFDCFSAAQH